MATKNTILFVCFLFCGCFAFAQNKYEREHRILKSQFPEEARSFVSENMQNAKNLKYYKEVDTASTRFSAKFKKDRLKYHMDFDSNSTLQSIGFQVKKIDIPSDTYSRIESYLATTFESFKIKRIFQVYQVEDGRTQEQLLKDAFQNMILPTNKFRFLVVAKKSGEKNKYELVFDAEGNLKIIKNALPANYDRVLY